MWRDGEPSRVEAGLGSSGVREPEGAGLRMRGTTKTMSPARGLSTVTNLAEAGGATGQPPPGGGSCNCVADGPLRGSAGIEPHWGRTQRHGLAAGS
jgi:hypothetical protein